MFEGPLHVHSCQAQAPVTKVAARCGSPQLLVYLPLLKDGLFLLLPEIVIWILETPSDSTGSARPASQRLWAPWDLQLERPLRSELPPS